jgi:hypothetical protein
MKPETSPTVSTGAKFPVPYGQEFAVKTNVYGGWLPNVLLQFKTYVDTHDLGAMKEALGNGFDAVVQILPNTVVYFMGLDDYKGESFIKVRFHGKTNEWWVLADDLKDFRYKNCDYTQFMHGFVAVDH